MFTHAQFRFHALSLRRLALSGGLVTLLAAGSHDSLIQKASLCFVAQAQQAAAKPPSPTATPHGLSFTAYLGEQHAKRLDGIKPEHSEIIINELKARKKGELDGSELIAVLPSTMGFLCTSNVFWRGTVLQTAILKKYAARLRLIPEEAEEAWTTALARVNESELQVMYNLGSIILQDRLFYAHGFRAEESRKLLKRLNSLPVDTVTRWAERRHLEPHQAALMLIGNDAFFNKEVFHSAAFKARQNSQANRER